MAGIEDGDDFSDDVLDNLDPDDFQQLQNQAYAASQQVEQVFPQIRQNGLYALPQAPERSALLPNNEQMHNEELLFDDPQPPAPQAIARPAVPPVGSARGLNKFGLPNVQRGPDEVTQREQRRGQRYGNAAPTRGVQWTVPLSNGVTNLHLPHRAAKAGPEGAYSQSQLVRNSSQQNGVHVDEPVALQSLRQELERARLEKAKLEQAVKAATDQVNAKNGEISIIRSNQAKAQREHERRLEEIHRQQQTENERHRAEIEQARKEKEKLATHNQFLDHEINDQNWQLKQAQRSKTSFTKQGGDRTPKKTAAAPLRDGFDDDEIMFVSPSPKSGGKGKPSTPRAGAKRKRDVLRGTPAPVLQLDNDGDSILPDAQPPPSPPKAEPKVVIESAGDDKSRLDLLQLLMSHRISRKEKRTLEALSQFSLPSQRENGDTLASTLMDQMASLSHKPSVDDFPGAVGSIVLSIWSGCLNEKYYEPVRFFIDLTKLILLNSPPSSAAYIITDLATIAQSTADGNVQPRFRRKPRVPAPDDGSSPPVEPQAGLQLLDLAATLLRRARPAGLGALWHAVRADFLSTVLRPYQDYADVLVLARLLATSVRPDGFAMVMPAGAEFDQATSEAHVVNRLTVMLVERPWLAEAEPEVDPELVAEMRLQVLDLLAEMCGKRYCAEALARHPLALGRLARCLHDELAALYDYRRGHEVRVELVNRSTRILFHLTTHYAEVIGDLQAKLRATTPTSVYKYLIGLARLAFSDGVFLERGIEEDVLDCAHQMLEGLVTPEEAEELLKVFVRET